MNNPHDFSFVSNANHLESTGGSVHVRSLSLHGYPIVHSAGGPTTHFHYAGSSQYLQGSHALLPTLQYSVPLLPQALAFPSEFQAGVPALTPAHVWTDAHVKHETERTSTAPSHSGPSTAPTHVSSPAFTPSSYKAILPPVFPPSMAYTRYTHKSPTPFHSAVLSPSTSTPHHVEDDDAKMESPMLSLEDICHVEQSSSDNSVAASASAQHAINAQTSAPLCGVAIGNNGAYSECPSSDYVTRTWSPPSPTTSLSCESFSESEGNIAVSASKRLFLRDLLRSPFSPPAQTKLNMTAFSPPPSGILVDINMRETAIRARTPSICVNPADIMTDSLRFPSMSSVSDAVSDVDMEGSEVDLRGPSSQAALPKRQHSSVSQRELTPPPDYTADFPDGAVIEQTFPDDAISAIVSVLQSSTVQPNTGQTEALPPQVFALKTDEVIAPRPTYPPRGSLYAGNDLGMLHPSLGPSDTGSSKAPRPSTSLGKRIPLAELPIPQAQHVPSPYAPDFSASYGPVPTYSFPSASIADHNRPTRNSVPTPNLGSPILNAHVGISLEDLKRRADEYRVRNHGADLDKTFLQSFAGRLSARGELLDDYRCYVIGCDQRNKRRDHILVHVGSHVEHRPWGCKHCGMKFLRKNECKRHESSHEGRKPYSCSICAPFQDRSFVRQDLLKRHMRVTHGFQETAGRRRKTAVKKDDDSDYWP